MDVDQEDAEARALFEERAEQEVPNQGDTLADRLTRPDPPKIPEASTDEIEESEQIEEKPTPEPVKAEEDVDIKALAKAFAGLSLKLDSGLRDLNGKFGGMNQQIQAFKTDLAAARQATVATARSGDDSPTQSAIDKAAAAKSTGDSSKWDALKNDFPEWAEALDERFGQRPQAPQKEVIREVVQPDPRIEELTQWRNQQEKQRQTQIVLEKHPDAFQLSATDDWKVFIAGLPPRVAGMVESEDASEVNYLLDLYKREKGINAPTSAQVAAERKSKLQGLVNPVRGQAQTKRTVVSEDEMSPEELFEHRAREEERQRLRR